MRLDSPGWLGVDETLLAVARQVEYTVVRNGSAWIRFLQDVRETLMGAPRTSARASNAGSSGTLRARHASQARAPRGLIECPAGAPRVPGAGAARARRAPSGCARMCRVRVPCGFVGCPPGAPRMLLPRMPERTLWRVQPDGGCPKDPAERTL